MTNEYLLLNDEQKASVLKVVPSNVTTNVRSIPETTFTIISCFLDGENKDNASVLSQTHFEIIKQEPFVLYCGSSAYYNKRLFPHVNECERLLRKLIYIAAFITDGLEATESFKELEKKTLGQIFEILLVDNDFIKLLKKRINAEKNSISRPT